MQKIEVARATDTRKMLSEFISVEITVFTNSSKAVKTEWFEVRD